MAVRSFAEAIKMSSDEGDGLNMVLAASAGGFLDAIREILFGWFMAQITAEGANWLEENDMRRTHIVLPVCIRGEFWLGAVTSPQIVERLADTDTPEVPDYFHAPSTNTVQ